jgi:hypothetical protein
VLLLMVKLIVIHQETFSYSLVYMVFNFCMSVAEFMSYRLEMMKGSRTWHRLCVCVCVNMCAGYLMGLIPILRIWGKKGKVTLYVSLIKHYAALGRGPTSRLSLGPTQPPIQRQGQSGRGAKPTIHIRQVPRSRMMTLYLHSPIYFHGVVLN